MDKELSRREVSALARKVYEAYLIDWRRRNPRAVQEPFDWDHLSRHSRFAWKQHVQAARAGTRISHPDQWVCELIRETVVVAGWARRGDFHPTD